MNARETIQTLRSGDVLVVVDVQEDFVSCSLAVPRAAEVIAPLNACMRMFASAGLTVVASRDWHPADHQSFRAQGGPWPVHCVAGTPGADFARGLALPDGAWIVSKATQPASEAYSAFEGTDLARRLAGPAARRLFVGGLATDYCVLRTVLDARRRGFDTVVLEDAIRAVNVHPGDGDAACAAMREAGAVFVRSTDLLVEDLVHG